MRQPLSNPVKLSLLVTEVIEALVMFCCQGDRSAGETAIQRRPGIGGWLLPSLRRCYDCRDPTFHSHHQVAGPAFGEVQQRYNLGINSTHPGLETFSYKKLLVAQYANVKKNALENRNSIDVTQSKHVNVIK